MALISITSHVFTLKNKGASKASSQRCHKRGVGSPATRAKGGANEEREKAKQEKLN